MKSFENLLSFINTGIIILLERTYKTIYSIIYYLFYPLFLIKKKYYKLENFKTESLLLANKFYNNEIFNPDDYRISYYILGGFYFYNVNTKKSLIRKNRDKIIDVSNGMLTFNNFDLDINSIPCLNPNINHLLNCKRILPLTMMTFEDGKITSLVLAMTLFSKKPYNIDLKIIFDPLLKVLYFSKEYSETYELDFKIFSSMTTTSPLPLNEELLLILLDCHSSNKEIMQLIPEFLIPSAYNFHSDEFQSRLLMVDIMLL